ncbi:MAG: hypothetical protein HXS54_01240 [Theionarchaea archaeon]|nr:hypothetical protein [Theionarchaea archaeon]
MSSDDHKEIFIQIFHEEFGYTEEEIEVILARSAEIKKELEEEERTSRNRTASSILNAHGIKHEEIISVTYGVFDNGLPFADIWYRNEDKIKGVVLKHFGDWKLHIHEGKVVD